MWRLPSCWRSNTLIDRARARAFLSFGAALHFVSPLRCAEPRVVRACLPPVGRAHRHTVLVTPASLIGSEFPSSTFPPALSFAFKIGHLADAQTLGTTYSSVGSSAGGRADPFPIRFRTRTSSRLWPRRILSYHSRCGPSLLRPLCVARDRG